MGKKIYILGCYYNNLPNYYATNEKEIELLVKKIWPLSGIYSDVRNITVNLEKMTVRFEWTQGGEHWEYTTQDITSIGKI